MRALICPQCGGRITQYREGATLTTCEYCATRFVIEENKQPRPAPVKAPEFETATSESLPPFVRTLGLAMGALALIAVIGLILVNTKGGRSSPQVSAPTFFRPSATPTAAPTVAPDEALLRFGSEGSNAGQFEGACAIAVDKQGSIYVGDNKLRVQQFDSTGEFVRVLQVPANGRNYERARTIDKLAVGADSRLYVGVGGVVLVYGKDWKEPQRVVQVAPNYIQDFALNADGSMVAVSDDDRIETLLIVNRSGAITRRIRGFHTDALQAAMAPLETAAESVRVAIASDGSIYSIYALGALGSYSLNIGDGDLRIAKFSSSGKFEKAFAHSSSSAGIFVDRSGRIFVSDKDSINAYTEDAVLAGSVSAGNAMTTFTIDDDGNIYTLAENSVAKWRLKE